LAAIVRAFKSNTTKRINAIRNTPGAPVWQRNYGACPERSRREHITRSEAGLVRVREYIRDNPAKWAEDPDDPVNAQSYPESHPRSSAPNLRNLRSNRA
jgi:putative transposase